MELNKSKQLYEEAVKLMPGGVSSPVRAVKPFPFYTASSYNCLDLLNSMLLTYTNSLILFANYSNVHNISN